MHFLLFLVYTKTYTIGFIFHCSSHSLYGKPVGTKWAEVESDPNEEREVVGYPITSHPYTLAKNNETR